MRKWYLNPLQGMKENYSVEDLEGFLYVLHFQEEPI